MPFSDLLTSLFARWLRIPDLSVRMFRAASRLSGLDRTTLPVELLPLNSIQMSRGLLNFTVLQTLDGWVLPFWVEQQYHPGSPAFIPRSHLGLSMNITHRNWTSAGSPECPFEPIVDPRGLVTFTPDGWSVDAWVHAGGRTVFPSRTTDVRQSLLNGLPLVCTTYDAGDIVLSSVVYTAGQTAVVRYRLTNNGTTSVNTRLGIAVRPFNPEGVALIESIRAEGGMRTLVVNGKPGITSDKEPGRVLMSDRDHGDVARRFEAGENERQDDTIACSFGLCTAVMVHEVPLAGLGEWECVVTYPLMEGTPSSVPSLEEVSEQWRVLLGKGSTCTLPPCTVADLFAASRSALVASLDGTSVRPGPATYHYFWFRDAAYMLLALDRLGFGKLTDSVIAHFPAAQDRSGMFRSQQGEWDSTGQAIWTAWHHALLTHDEALLGQLFGPLQQGVRWIEGKLVHAPDDPCSDGLMPRGLSAEHLGLADVYFWDSLWSLAGLEAFVRICGMLGRERELSEALTIAARLRDHLERSFAAARERTGVDAIPASPYRMIDSGIIGNVAGWYPLQLYPPGDIRMRATMNVISEKMFRQGLFYQPFVHSGLNVYLTLQVAQALLYDGDAEAFWQILMDVSGRATSTFTYPEAIHPLTGGGCMGDGHHGWAAAEVVLAIRNAFASEMWGPPPDPHTVRFLSGIPLAWFDQAQPFGLADMPLPEGRVDVMVQPQGNEATVEINLDPCGLVGTGQWMLSLPGEWQSIACDGQEIAGRAAPNGRTEVPIPARSLRIFARRNSRQPR